VDITVMDGYGGWLAVAWIGGEPELGFGSSRELAMVDALSTLGAAAAATLISSFGTKGT
jgi:hypothetical protein